VQIGRLTRHLAVIAAGVTGVEYAAIFSDMGAPATLIQPRALMLDFMDHEMVEDFAHQLRDRGMTSRFGARVTAVEPAGEGPCLIRPENGQFVQADMVLCAAARTGCTTGLNLGACGIQLDGRGRLTVNRAASQTSQPHIYAAGDVVDFSRLASTSMEQDRISVCHTFGVQAFEPPRLFPYGIYPVPENPRTV
jgi:NAD(P) transhydrogenase